MAVQTRNEALRSLAFGSISSTYADVGTLTTHAIYQVTITNDTNATMIFSKDDGSTDWVAIPAGVTRTFDYLRKNEGNQTALIPVGTQFQVKDTGAAASSGAVYISVEHFL